MKAEDEVFFKNLSIICFSLVLKGDLTFKNFFPCKRILYFIEVLKSLEVEISLEENILRIKSLGALHLFEPQKEIDVNGIPELVFVFCALFAPYDYNVFLTDSSRTLNEHSFHSLILGLYDVGVRFSYSKDFTLPLSIKGTSNFLPMKHHIKGESPLLELVFLILGLCGFAKTSVILEQDSRLAKTLEELKANCKIKQNEIEVCLHPQNVFYNLEINLTKL